MLKKILILISVASLLYACGTAETAEPTVDISAIHTSAAQTVMAEFTQTAKAVPPTAEATATEAFTATPETPQPTDTPTVAVDASGATVTPLPCDDAIYVSDITYPDGSEVTPEQDFVKTWKVKNTGTCIWGTGYSIIFAYGEKMGGVAEPLPAAVAPGEEVEVSVRFKAPTNTGEFASTWRMANASNSPFGEYVFMKIVVR